ncbi:unnamed protein product [Nippostrongylus brasiliensis]|uniref:long-chain-fatty-acid--CoA ligase n=1 Tax=Nippostrongylus brasiliensis TaxID=27835 RepID=A0A0N4YSR1_NIPBR|nr:unnamed protein product [Nippostrongylus brasiliensis]
MSALRIYLQVVKGSSPFWIRILVGILRIWFFIYDCLNYIPYQLFNSPVEKLRKSDATKAQWVDARDGPIRHVDGLKTEQFPGKNTVDKVWRHIVELYDESPALGTRQLLAVHHEKQAGGRVFEKWELGEYEWMSYREVEAKVSVVAAGLKDLATGDEPKVVIFAETRAHWLITALACFRANIPIVTVYATLGEDAIMDRIFKAVSEEVAASPRIMQELFKLNYERKRARYQEGYCSPFLDRIIFKKIRKLLGGQLKGVLSGGAPLNAETQRFMNICMCCPVVQGYGLTETCGAACVADINDLSTGTVGPPVRCCEILLREWAEGGYSPFNDPPRGEILISGENVSPGYFKLPEKTDEEFIMYKGKRCFCTGDIGEKRKDGSIIIVDRKKDLVKLQHGEYVSLAKVRS